MKDMRGISDGTVRPRRIRFRKGDFFHEMADAFNAFQEKQGVLSDSADDKPDEPLK